MFPSPPVTVAGFVPESPGPTVFVRATGKLKEYKTHGWNTKAKRELMAHEDLALERLSKDDLLQSNAVQSGVGGALGNDDGKSQRQMSGFALSSCG